MKVRERKISEGLGGGKLLVRVREIGEGEALPADAEVVPNATAVHDWRPEEEEE